MAAQSSSRRRNDFWNRKMAAYRQYGVAESRPQENFKNYLISKRKLNLGMVVRRQNNWRNVEGFGMVAGQFSPSPPTFKQPTMFGTESYRWVDTDASFTAMMQDIVRCHEISIDLEGNMDHSYYGMSCLLQIGTYTTTYLVDPFPTFDEISTRLKPVLESTKCLKLMHGMDNDVIALSRDFDINVSAVIDVQLVQKWIFKTLYDDVVQRKFKDIRQKDVDGILWRSIADPLNSARAVLSNDQILKLHTDKISLENLVKIYFPTTRLPPDSTLADWRLRSLPAGMLEYAVFDAHMVLHIWAKMKQVLLAQPRANWILERCFEDGKVLLRKYFIPPAELTCDAALAKARLNPVDRDKFEVIYMWRENQGKIVDESVNELLTMQQINELIRLRAISPASIIPIVNRGRRIPCESVDDWAIVVGRLVGIGRLEWNHMVREVKCHCCRGRHAYPHMAWGCVEKYSRQAVNAYMREPENAEFARREEARRRANWVAKRGPNIPYPGDKR